MFWGCFSYDEKGPCHIWDDETEKEKREAKAWMKARNEEREANCRNIWEIETALRRLDVRRNKVGPKLKWVWSEKTGKLERKASKGGIDWYRYYKEILIKKLLPFAKHCKLVRPDTIVQEDNAAPHAHNEFYNLWNIIRMIWPPNSPDLNMIEPCWFWMKRQTTKYGVASSVKQLRKDWEECWERLPQSKIQEWIERIPEHINRILDPEIDGGNGYREGLGRWGEKRKRNSNRVRP
jgi:transposase